MASKVAPAQSEAVRVWRAYAPKRLHGLVRTYVSTAEAQASFAFSPTEQRDWHGRWVALGGEGKTGGDYSFKERSEYTGHNKPLAAAYAGWASKLSGPERRALFSYKTAAYLPINRYVRGGQTQEALHTAAAKNLLLGLSADLSTIPDTVRAIDSALARPEAVAPSDMIVFRGGQLADEDNDNIWQLGEVLRDDAYVSTSLDPVTAKVFADAPGSELFAIEIPKGSRAAFLNALQDSSEEEVLLPRGARFAKVGTYRVDVSVTRPDLEVPRLRYLGVGSDAAKFGSKPKRKAQDGAGRFEWQPGDVVRTGEVATLPPAEPMAEFMFNPAESRDWHGRWVRGAGGGAYVGGHATKVELPDEEQQAYILAHDPRGIEEVAKAQGLKVRPAAPIVPKIESHVPHRPTPDYVDPKLLDAVDNYNKTEIPVLGGWAQEHKMTDGQYKQEAQKHLEELVSKARLARRMSYSNIERVLDGGGFKTVFAKGAVGGMQTKDTYREWEHKMWGYPQRGMDDSLRPIFGYLTDDPDTEVPDTSSINDYGDTTVVLKDALRARTTFALHDSFGGVAGGIDMGMPYAMTVPLQKPDLRSYSQVDLDILKLPHIQEAEAYAEGDSYKFAYAEAQYHEGVKLDDIDYFVLPKEPTPELAAKLKAHAKPWKILKQRTRPPKTADFQAYPTEPTALSYGSEGWYDQWAVQRGYPMARSATEQMIVGGFYG